MAAYIHPPPCTSPNFLTCFKVTGYLSKQGEKGNHMHSLHLNMTLIQFIGLMKTWKKRWFVFDKETGELFYYITESTPQHIGLSIPTLPHSQIPHNHLITTYSPHSPSPHPSHLCTLGVIDMAHCEVHRDTNSTNKREFTIHYTTVSPYHILFSLLIFSMSPLLLLTLSFSFMLFLLVTHNYRLAESTT